MPAKSIPAIRHGNRFPRLLSFFFLASTLGLSTFGLVGCGDGTSKGITNSIKGKVTMDGKPVSGTVVFVGSNKSEIVAPITLNGEYTIPNPPKGEGYFLVKSMLAGSPPPPAGDKKGKATPEMKDDPTKNATAPGGDPPPAKYAKPDNGLPKVNYTSGELVQDLTLTP